MTAGFANTLTHIRIEDGNAFSGTPEQFASSMYDFEGEVTRASVRDYAYANGWTDIEFTPPTTIDLLALADQLRTHAERARQNGDINNDTANYLWSMADAVDGGTGSSVHKGCPDPDLPTAQCEECALVLDVEVSGGDPGRASTIFDLALQPDGPLAG